MVDIGKCVRVAQEMRGVSTKQMAADLKTTKQQVWRWRNAEDMKLSKIEELAEYFDITLYQFLTIGDVQWETSTGLTRSY